VSATNHFHWTGEGTGKPVSNWGDLLGELLVGRFAGIKTKLAPFADAELVTVGSVLQLCPPGWAGVVAGAGKIHADSPFLPSRRTRVKGLRGPLTARGIPGTYAIGDPGLLARDLLDELPPKRHALGLIQHWSDDELLPKFAHLKPAAMPADSDPLEMIRFIASCRKIVTSSLHGCIVADSLAIPRRIEPMRLSRTDSWYKFVDYHLSVNHEFRLGITTSPKYSAVEDRTHELHDMFRSLKGDFK
jgi:hypothetical protein